MSGKRHLSPARVPEWLGGGVPMMGSTSNKNTNHPVFVDPSGRRVVAARFSAATLTLVGVAFITGAGMLLSNQPTPTALADVLSPGALARAVGADPIADVLTNSLSGEVAPTPRQSSTVPGQVAPGVDRVDVTQAPQYPVGVSPGGAPAASNPYTGQGELMPATPLAGSPVAGSPIVAPPAAAPAAAAPAAATPPAEAPPVVVPPVAVPPVAVPPVVNVETPAEQPAGLLAPVVPVIDPVVSAVGSLLGALL
jgi:hypothetical protein